LTSTQRHRDRREPQIALHPMPRFVLRARGWVRRQVVGPEHRTRSFNTVNPGSQPTRSAITVAGIVGVPRNNARIFGSTASTTDPPQWPLIARRKSLTNARLTALRETPNSPNEPRRHARSSPP
jgi:hypothetical protein